MDQNASVIWGLFYAFGTSKCAGSNSKLIMVNWKECGWTGKSVEGRGFGLYFFTMSKFDWRDWGNPRTFYLE